jgi:hypothetical protein
MSTKLNNQALTRIFGYFCPPLKLTEKAAKLYDLINFGKNQELKLPFGNDEKEIQI